METCVVTLSGGIGNIVSAMPFMWHLKAAGWHVVARELMAWSREACELTRPAYDEIVGGTSHVVGAVDKGNPLAGAPGKRNDVPEWEAWFQLHGMNPPKAEEARTDTAWDEPPESAEVVLAPTSKGNWPMKFWPHWGRLAEMLPGCAVVGLPGDGGNFGPGCLDLRGRLTLRQAAGAFRKAKLVVAQEGGMGHLSAAQGTRTLILYGGTSWYKNMPPRSGTLVLPRSPMACQPCQFDGCFSRTEGGVDVMHGCRPEKKVDGRWARCMDALTPERVMEVVGR